MPLTPDIAHSVFPAGSEGQTRDNRECSSLQVKKLTSWEEWEALSLDWEQILRDAAGLTIFLTPEWLGAWWKAFGKEKQLVAFSFSNARGEVIGLAPLYLDGSKNRRFKGVKRLRLVGDGTGDSDNLDLMFSRGHEVACSEALLARLASERGWDVCELNTLNADSHIAEAMLAGLRERRWPTLLSKRPNSAVLLPDTWETYLHQLSREHAGGIERYTRRLGRHYRVRIFKCAAEEELSPCLEILFDLHQKRWKSQGQQGSFAGPARRQFYYEMSRAFLRNAWLEFWLLELDGKPAAAQFAFRYRDTVYQLQEGLDPRHYSDRAGIVLRAHVLKQLIAEGVRQYDFLGGAEAHKRSWGARPGSYIDICFAKPLSRGSLYLSLKNRTRVTRGWLRTHTPDPVLRVLRQVSHRVSRMHKLQ
jgi:CelD/BcsL family acetyltransferase involved in cellulose biosynthesis